LHSISNPGYRRDIDGLRAIAVLSVVAFHAFPAWIKGGFIGVDIFFVISGYLISGIVYDGLQSGRFRFADFYARRIRRIFPALLLVLVSCLCLGWYFLLPDEFKSLGKHVAGGSTFISNFLLLNESGYFDSAAESKQLLHLWSLAVEEQFYVFWPLLLWIAHRLKWNFLIVSALAAAVSFSLNIWQAGSNISADFYYPQTRFWELMLGSVLAWLTRNASAGRSAATASAMSATGLCLLAGGFWLLDKDIGFPGKWALVPVIGAVLIIYAGPDAWVNRVVLSSRIMVWIGLISFPLYLWHWPLLSFLRSVLVETPGAGLRAGAVLVSVLLAWLTYRFVEGPVRFGVFGRLRTGLLVGLLGVAGILGLDAYHRDGMSERSRERDEFVAYFAAQSEWEFPGNGVTEAYRHQCNFWDVEMQRTKHAFGARKEIDKECYVKDHSRPKSILLWGDSHAQQLYIGLSQELPRDWQILQVATSGCDAYRPRPVGDLIFEMCERSSRQAREIVSRAKPDVVLIAQFNPLDANDAVGFNKELMALGARQVVFVGPATRWQGDLHKLIARKFYAYTPRYTFSGVDMAIYAKNLEWKQQYSNASISYVDLMSLLCTEEGCMTYLGNDVRKGLTTMDYGHLLPVASTFVARNLLVPKIHELDS